MNSTWIDDFDAHETDFFRAIKESIKAIPKHDGWGINPFNGKPERWPEKSRRETETNRKGNEMKASQLIESKYLKKEDAGDGILVTVRDFKKENVGREDEQEVKWVVHFDECKPMVLNSTNIALIEKALGTDETDDWIGQKIVLFNDENVSFGGKVTGGVRVDVNRTKRYHAKSDKPAPVKTAGQRIEDMESDVPFR